jgi:integrase
MNVSVSVLTSDDPVGYAVEQVEVLPFSWRDPWRADRGRRDPAKGQYQILTTGSGENRLSLSLGWMSDEEAALYCRGLNLLCRSRAEFTWYAVQVTGREALPPDPPITADFILPTPLEAGGGTIPAVSDRWLIGVLRAGGVADQKRVAQEKVLGFLRRMADLDPPSELRTMSRPSVLDAVRRARSGINPGDLTLREYVEQVWAPIRRAQNAGEWRKEEGRLRLHVLPRVGHAALSELDARDLFACARDARKADGTPAAYNSRRLILNAIIAIGAYAYGEHHVKQRFDFAGLRLKGSTVKPLAQESLTAEQMSAILLAGRTVRDRALLAAIFGTSGRPSETAKLDWKDVIWEASADGRHPHGTIRLRGTKTGRSDRTVPMLPLLREPLLEYWTALGDPPEGVMFKTARGKPYAVGDGASYFRKMLRNAADRAGLTNVRVTPYTARHTYGTLLLEVGVAESTVKALLGHDPMSRTLEAVYDHRTVLKKVAGRDLPELRVATGKLKP